MSALDSNGILAQLDDLELRILAKEVFPDRASEIQATPDLRAWIQVHGDWETILPKIPLAVLERLASRPEPVDIAPPVAKPAVPDPEVAKALQRLRDIGASLQGPETVGDNIRQQVVYSLELSTAIGKIRKADLVPRTRSWNRQTGWKIDRSDLRRTHGNTSFLSTPKYMSPADTQLIAACDQTPRYGWGPPPTRTIGLHALLNLAANTQRLVLPDGTALHLDPELWRLIPSLEVDDQHGLFAFAVAQLDKSSSTIGLSNDWTVFGDPGNLTLLIGSTVLRLDPRTPMALLALAQDLPRIPLDSLSQVRAELSVFAKHGVQIPREHLPPRLRETPMRTAAIEISGESAMVCYQITYPSVEVPEDTFDPVLAFTGDDGTLMELERDLGAEEELSNELEAALTDAGVNSIPSDNSWLVTEPASLRELALHAIPKLEAAGWDVREASRLDRWKLRTGVFRAVGKASGQDWFELSGVVDFDGLEIPLSTLIAQKGTIKLSDGSTGEVSEALLKRLHWMERLGRVTENGIELRGFHAALAQELGENGHAKILDTSEWNRQLKQALHVEPVDAPVPVSLKATLRPYQKQGLDWLTSLRQSGIGGILADDMGLGKTVQLIAHLCRLFESDPVAKPALVVGPASVVGNWISEIERFAPHLQTRLLHGTLRDAPRDAPITGPTVFVTTYGTLPRELEWIHSREFSIVVLDESQAIRNPATQAHQICLEVDAEQKVCLTGTPIENSLSDLWAQFSFLNPGLLGPREEFVSQFTPDPGKKPDLSRLRLLTAPFWLRRTKHLVARDLPPREDIVLNVELDPKQMALYQRQLKEYQKNLLPEIKKNGLNEGGRFQVLTALLRLRQIACAPELAGHKGPSAKLDLLVEKLAQDIAEGHRALVFSSFTSLLDLVEKRLRKESLRFLRIDGSTPASQRTRLIERFQSELDEPIFLVSLKAGGAGINLTAADDVFLLDPWWNPAVEEQAAARAHRIGQERPVTLYRMVAKGTIEERVLALSKSKAALASELFDAGETGGTALTPEVVAELLG